MFVFDTEFHPGSTCNWRAMRARNTGAGDDGAGGGGDGNGNDGKDGAGNGNGDGETFTQAQLDKIVGQRVAEERAKYPDYDDYKDKASKYDKVEADGKTPDQRLADLETRLAASESARQKAELAQLRSDRAAEVEDFPKSLIKRLTGTTADEIDAEITEIMGDLKVAIAGDRRPDGSGGSSRSGGNQAKPSTMAAGSELYAKLHPKK